MAKRRQYVHQHLNDTLADFARRLGDEQVFTDLIGGLIPEIPEATPSTGTGFVASFPSANHNSEFMVFASAIARPTNAWSNGVAITWELLSHTSAHGSTFFSGVQGLTGNKRLEISFPNVKNVFNASVTLDEGMAAAGVQAGPTVATNKMEIAVNRPQPIGIRLTGAGTTTWTKSSNHTSQINVSTYNGQNGSTGIEVTSGGWGVDYNAMNITYLGPNRYTVRRIYSALGSYGLGFKLVDAAGADLSTNPTTSDEVQIGNMGLYPATVDMFTFNGSNNFLSTSHNFWILGLFEAWMVVTPVSTTSTLVKFQTDYPSATNYKVYRDTQSSFATQQLIYTGTAGTYTDTGLTTKTLYYYKLVGVVSAVDTDITTFRVETL